MDKLAQKIIALTGSRSKVSRPAVGDKEALRYEAWLEHATTPNIAKIKGTLGWFPLVVVDEGLRATVDYLKSLRDVKRLVN